MSDQISDNQEMPNPPLAGLDMVAALVREPRRWSEWLSGHPDRSELFAEIFGQAILLANSTRWEMQTLLSQLGCRVQTTVELGKMEEDELRGCRDYFALAGSLVDLLPSIADRREIVSGVALLFHDSGGDVDLCKESLEAGTFSAVELIELGELEKAWAFSRLHLAGPAGDRARFLQQTNPFVKSEPHLSDALLDRYAVPSSDLDDEMRSRIAKHLELCPACSDAFHERRLACAQDLASAV